jgi:protein DEK
MQKLKPRHCGDGEGPPEQDKEEPGRDTKGRRIQEESKAEDEDVSKEDGNQIATPDEQPQQETQVQDKEEEDTGYKEQQDTELEHPERETTESEDEEDERNTKRYNLRKRKGRTVYVSASKIFQLDNLRETDHVIEAMKRGYKVSIGETFFAGSGGSAKMDKRDGRGNQQDDDKGDPQPEQGIDDRQPQQQKQLRMLTNLA